MDMIENKIDFKILSLDHVEEIAALGQQLNPALSLEELKSYLAQMFAMDNYTCFGLLLNENLVGISSAWTTVRFYSGKQLEVDNVIIDGKLQSKGLGKTFFGFIEDWAKQNGYNTVELNTYVENAQSHKFYFNAGYSILGFHFCKSLR